MAKCDFCKKQEGVHTAKTFTGTLHACQPCVDRIRKLEEERSKQGLTTRAVIE